MGRLPFFSELYLPHAAHFTKDGIVTTLEAARAAFAFEPLLVLKAELPFVGEQLEVFERIRALINAWLDREFEAILPWALAQLPAEKMAKADAPDIDPAGLYRPLAIELGQASAAGSLGASMLLGIDLETPPAGAVAFAKERAAELVGKKLVDGKLVDNPNLKWVITETLRESVKNTVARAVEQGLSPQELTASLRTQFGDWRAETIARSETGMAYGNGAAEVYRENDVAYVEIYDGDGCLPEGHDDNAPAPIGTPGVVQSEAQANGQIWNVDQYQAHLLGHPNCVRGAVPWFRTD